MAELVKPKRVAFLPGRQGAILIQSKNALGITYIQLAQLLRISTRTLTDWKREKFTISLPAVRFLCKKTGRPFPYAVEIKNPFWYTRNGSSAGGKAVYKKYGYISGNPEHRKQKWYDWWEREGRFKPHPIINVALPIKKPRNSVELAEFVGVVLGYGGISKRQVIITLNHRDDRAYGIYVMSLIKKLFDVKPKIYYDSADAVDNIVVSRSELVKFCTDVLGLKIGSKVKQ